MILAAHTRRISRIQLAAALSLAVAGVTGLAPVAHADFIKANNTTPLNNAGSWVGGVAPPTDGSATVTWDSTVTGPNDVAVGDSLQNWLGIKILSPGGGVIIDNDTNGPYTFTLGAGGIDASLATQTLTINAGMSLSASQSWNVASVSGLTINGPVNNNGNTLTITGEGNTLITNVVSGTGELIKSGTGILTMTSSNTYTGNTLVQGGKLLLNFTAPGATSQDILANTGTVTLGGNGSVFAINGPTSGATASQTLASLALSGAGMNSLLVTSGTSAASTTVNLGTLIRAGSAGGSGSLLVITAPTDGSATLLATVGAGVTTGGAGILVGTGAGVQKGAFATYGLDDYAGLSGGLILPGSSIPSFYSGPPANNSNTATNFDVTANYTSGTSTTVVNSVRFNTAGADSFVVRSANWGTGGFLITPNMGADNVTIIQGGGGALVPSRDTTSSEMVIWQNNTQAEFIINVPINERTLGVVTQAGPGTVLYNAASGRTGQTNLSGGFSVITSDGALGNAATGAAVNIGGGALVANPSGPSMSLDNNGANLRPVNLVGAGGTIAAVTGKQLTVTGVVSGTGPLVIGAGTLAGTGAGTANPTAIVGDGSVSFTGTGNTYSGGTTVANGTFRADNLSGSATGTGGVTVNSGATLGGNGLISGNVLVNGGGHFAPGDSVGTLTVGGLSLQASAKYDFEANVVANDLTVLSTNGLSLASGVGISLFSEGTTNPINTNGVFNVFQVDGGAFPSDSTLQSNFSVLNPSIAGTPVYTWGHSGSFITLTVSGLLNITSWNIDGGSTWNNAANWTAGVPDTAGAVAKLGAALVSGNATITLDGSRTLGTIAFNNSVHSYTVAAGTGGSLVLDNLGGSASVLDGAGSHTVSADVTLNGDVTISVTRATDVLTLSGNISGAHNVTVSGAGSVLLGGINTYGNTSILSGSKLQLGNGGASGSLGSGPVADAGNLIFDRSDAVTVANDLSGAGNITLLGAGTVTLTSTNNALTGATTIDAGKLALGPGSSIGVGALTVAAGGALDLGGNNVTASTLSGLGLIDNSVAALATLSITGAATFGGTIANTVGTVGLTKSGGGILSLTGDNTLSGPVTVLNGSIQVNSSASVGSGLITINLGPANTNGIILTNGVNLASNITVTNTTFEFMNVPANSVATLSGNVTDADNQYRMGVNGTLVLTGTTSITTTNTFITFGNVIIGGNAVFSDTTTLAIGRATTAANVTVRDNAVVTLAGLTLAQTGAANPSDSLTIQDNAIIDLGTAGTFTTNLSGAPRTTLHLNGGSLSLFSFTTSTGNSTLNFNGGHIVAAADNSSFMPSSTGLTAAVGAGGAVIDTNGHTIGIDQTISGGLPGAQDGGLTVLGTGSLQLNGANTYTGDTHVGAGVLIVGFSPQALGFGGNMPLHPTIGKTFVDAGGTLDLNGTATLPEPLVLNGGTLTNSSAFLASSVNRGIVGVNVNNVGSVSSFAQLSFTDSTGTGAFGVPLLGLSGGSFQISAPGSGYTAAPTVTITGGGGTGATATATLGTDGSVTGIVLTNPGIGFSSLPTVTLAAAPTTGSSAAVSVIDGTFNVEGTNLTLPGDAYSANPVITLSSGETISATAILPSISLAPSTTSTVNVPFGITFAVPLTGSGNMNVTGGGTLTLTGQANITGSTGIASSTVFFSGSQSHAIGLIAGATGTVQIDAATSVKIHPNASLTGRTSAVGTLILAGTTGAWTSTLDLTNNNMIVSNDANVVDQIKSSANLGAWNGTGGGITSSSALAAATSSTATALGYATGAEYTAATGNTLFDGLSFNPTDTIIKYTLAGDANMDGSVTFADFLALQNDYNKPGDWAQGDWNYDGQVTFADFLILQNNYNKVLGVGSLLPAGLSAPTLSVTAAPEPAALTLLGLGGLALLSRRRRRN